MLDQLTLQFGASPSAQPLSLSLGPMTVLVGPNNSGKSQALREIEGALGHPAETHTRRIVRWVTFRELPQGELKTIIERTPHLVQFDDTGNEYVGLPVYRLGNATQATSVIRKGEHFIMPGGKPEIDLRQLLPALLLRLDGTTRLTFLNEQPLGNLHTFPASPLSALFRNDDARARVQRLTEQAFGHYFVLDLTSGGNLQARMADTAPTGDVERSLSDAAISYHGAAAPILEFSDGVKAYVGLVAAALSAGYQIMLVDEPEAFLHPPLVRTLGHFFTDVAAERGGNSIVATHSADFLMAAVDSGRAVNVIRLTFDRSPKGGLATARLLDSEKLRALMNDPLFRSAGMLSALFHRGAVVAEADRDRAFYQEINERLRATGRRGAEDTVFLNANNGKDVVGRIVRPLREMGLPAAAIVDLDILESGAFAQLCESCFVPQPTINGWSQTRGELRASFKTADAKNLGISALPPHARESSDGLIRSLAEYGIFVVPVGEVEGWLRYLGVDVPKYQSLVAAFTRLGSSPDDQTYEGPRDDDVWAFLDNVAKWIADPRRKGIPA